MSSNIRESIIDLFWPHLTDDQDCEPRDIVCLEPEYADLLDDVEAVSNARIVDAEERHSNVEKKLLALLTLTTVFSAAITAGFVAAATLNVDKANRLFALVTIFLVAYIALQLTCSLRVSMAGQ